VHTVVAGDTLASVAFRQYGDPAMWRPLAAFNGIDDPLRVRPGATLFVPALEELPRSGG
jgi:nucleoid-associated protein YgaU